MGRFTSTFGNPWQVVITATESERPSNLRVGTPKGTFQNGLPMEAPKERPWSREAWEAAICGAMPPPLASCARLCRQL
jgi:hypothetical protein